MVKTGLAIVAYFFGIVGGIVVYLVSERRDRFTRFHAIQSMLFCISVGVIGIILMAASFPFGFLGGWALGLGLMGLWVVYGLVALIIWIILMVKAYQGEKYQLPVIGRMASDWSR